MAHFSGVSRMIREVSDVCGTVNEKIRDPLIFVQIRLTK